MVVTTVGKILLKSIVPKELHSFVDSHELDKKNISSLFTALSHEKPGEYRDIATKLTRLGFEVSTRQGSTVKLTDLLPPIDKQKKFDKADKEIAEIRRTAKSPDDANQKINQLYRELADELNKEIVEVGIKNNQTLAKVVKAGARGSPSQYRQTVLAPLIVADAKGRVMTDFPIRRSFAEGLTLPEYLAHTFGARQGAVATKLAVADAGAFSKQLARAAMTTQVEEHDCGTASGIEVSVDDKDNLGTFLAKPVGGYNKNNEVTGRMMADLRNKGIMHLLVRSPMTCQSPKHFHNGSVCQLCVGKREKNSLPPIGDYIGITAATTLGEPLSQGQLNTKHESGSAAKKSVSSGFDVIKQLATIPKTFKNKAAISEIDGKITEIRKAPQGGYYIVVENKA